MWKLPTFEVRTSSGPVDTDLIAVFQDSAKKPVLPTGTYSGTVDRFRASEAFTARVGAVQFLRFGGKGAAENAVLVGLGQAAELTEEKARSAGGYAWHKMVAEKAGSVAVHVDSLLAGSGQSLGDVLDSDAGLGSPSADRDVAGAPADPLRLIRAFAEGLVLSAYQFTKYKSKPGVDSTTPTARSKKAALKATAKNTSGPERLIFVAADASFVSRLNEVLPEVAATAAAMNIARDWSNEPSNLGTPEYYAAEAQRLAREYGLRCRVLSEVECARQKMGLFLGVGQGSVREGKVVVLEYLPKGYSADAAKKSAQGGKSRVSIGKAASKSAGKKRAVKTVAFVGKGITFDSGGISIKPAMRMEEMKHDMTGAATVLGAILCAAAWEVPNRVLAIMGFTENMPDGEAIQPGNVITGRSGKTVEVFNTDAEGRLILADLLDYAQDEKIFGKIDVLVDAATLTGAVGAALGKHCCAILGNDEGLITAVRDAGQGCGERLWQLPLWDEYFDDLKSECADMKNVANDGYGGTIRGAIFLKQFIKKTTKWAHLDIAVTSYNISHLSYLPKRGASGSYIRTLAHLAREL